MSKFGTGESHGTLGRKNPCPESLQPCGPCAVGWKAIQETMWDIQLGTIEMRDTSGLSQVNEVPKLIFI